MIEIAAVLQTLCQQVRSEGAPQLASSVGATQLCLFLRDIELNKFLPAPGFPQTFPAGLAWTAFLRKVEQDGQATSNLPSPFSGERSVVVGKLTGPAVILVLFGPGTSATAHDDLYPAVSLLAAIFQHEAEVRLKTLELKLVRANAVESQQLARSLSDVHEQLAAALQRSHALGQEVYRQQETLDLARQISGIGLWTFHIAQQALRLSEQAASILGIQHRSEYLPLSSLLDRIHPEDRPLVKEAFRSDLEAKPHNVQFRLYWDKDTLRYIENRGVVVRDEHDRALLTGLSLDITDRVRTEDALIRSEKLAAAGRLAATIAHEINNPLEGLVNLIYLASSSDDISNVRELLHQAESEISRISSVARQTLAFYRDLNNPVEFDLRIAIEESLRVLNKEAQMRQISVVADLPERPATLRGSLGELKQVFSNLLINAVHASSTGSLISIRIRSTSSGVVLLMADQGHGISPEHLGRIFEPFFSTRKESGTGLGLWVTRQIVQKHGGSLRVRSSTRQDCHGTVFRIVLPSADCAPVAETTSLRYRWLELTS
ncbi:PAS domain-containing protein [Edaphobacter sp. HDX4]|uniref:sensor histidine kinase n=1 Tax=Edaphobacter sp. HDX4 TaxID=2794064 RepID=UPI002FE51103